MYNEIYIYIPLELGGHYFPSVDQLWSAATLSCWNPSGIISPKSTESTWLPSDLFFLNLFAVLDH
jgi:hypothetical protein